MSAIDYIFLVALITGAVYGFIKGSISQVAGLFSIYAGLVLASAFSDVVSKWLAPYVGLDPHTRLYSGSDTLNISYIYSCQDCDTYFRGGIAGACEQASGRLDRAFHYGSRLEHSPAGF